MNQVEIVAVPKCGCQFGITAEKDVCGSIYYVAWKSLPKGSNGCLGDWLFQGQFPTKAQASNYICHEALKERSRKLKAVEYPYTKKINKDGSFNIPTLDESLYWEYVAGLIALYDAAVEFAKANWTPFVDIDYTQKKFNEIDKKYHKFNPKIV